jgi:hypothetical protein
MSALTVVTALLVSVLAVLGIAKVLAVPPIRARAAHVDFSVAAYRGIGCLEMAAVLGLVAGLRWPALGLTATAGVLLLMAGALTAHVRAGDSPRGWLPAIGTALLAGTYVLLAWGAVA